MGSPSHKVKAVVLLSEQQYLERHICCPLKYFPLLTKKGVLSAAQCSDIKNQQSVEYQVQKFVELLTLSEIGYDVFLQALKTLRVNANVATYLKKKVIEFDRLSSQGQLPSELQKLVSLLEFVERTKVNHDFARDVLTAKEWDLEAALLVAMEMGHHDNNPEVVNAECASQESSETERSGDDPEANLSVVSCDMEHPIPSPPDSNAECLVPIHGTPLPPDSNTECPVPIHGTPLPPDSNTESLVPIRGTPLPPDSNAECLVPIRGTPLPPDSNTECLVPIHGMDPIHGALPPPDPNVDPPSLGADVSDIEVDPEFGALPTPPQEYAPPLSVPSRPPKDPSPHRHSLQHGPASSGPPSHRRSLQHGHLDLGCGVAAGSNRRARQYQQTSTQTMTPTPGSFELSSSENSDLVGEIPRASFSSPSFLDQQKSLPPTPSPMDQRRPLGPTPSRMDQRRPLPPTPSPMDQRRPLPPTPSPMDQRRPLGPTPSPMDRRRSLGPTPSPMDQRRPLGPTPSPMDQRRPLGPTPSPMDQRRPLGPTPSPMDQRRPLGPTPSRMKDQQRGQLWSTPTPPLSIERAHTAPRPPPPEKKPPLQGGSDVAPYLMEMTDEEAISRMRSLQRPGVFFVRHCNKKDTPFTLCTTDGENLIKYHIVHDPRGYHIDSSSTRFPSMLGLIQHYSGTPIGSKIKLTMPLAKPHDKKISDPETTAPQLAGRLRAKSSPAGSDERVHCRMKDAESQTELLPIPDKPTMLKLQSMRDENFEEIRTIDEVACIWDQVAVALEIEQRMINIIRTNYPRDVKGACYEMFREWINGPPSKITWKCLIDALNRADFKVLATRVDSSRTLHMPL